MLVIIFVSNKDIKRRIRSFFFLLKKHPQHQYAAVGKVTLTIDGAVVSLMLCNVCNVTNRGQK